MTLIGNVMTFLTRLGGGGAMMRVAGVISGERQRQRERKSAPPTTNVTKFGV